MNDGMHFSGDGLDRVAEEFYGALTNLVCGAEWPPRHPAATP
jgi:hypothetical protein